jgi:Tfp pilus assembly ATPase PilU
MAVDIAQLLAFAVKNKASDLHLSSGVPPMIRVDGDMKRVNMPPLTHKEVHSMVYDIMNDTQRKMYEEFLEIDFSFEIDGLARFRVNAFNHNRGAGAVFSFDLKGNREQGKTFIETLKLFSHLANVGDCRSLVIHPASTTHFRMSDEALAGAGITQGTIRLSIGLEDADDLIDDLKRALKAAQKTGV